MDIQNGIKSMDKQIHVHSIHNKSANIIPPEVNNSPPSADKPSEKNHIDSKNPISHIIQVGYPRYEMDPFRALRIPPSDRNFRQQFMQSPIAYGLSGTDGRYVI